MALERDTRITWWGHSCVEILTPGGKTILIDPWFANPRSPKPESAVERCELMLVTHGHFDHMGDAVHIASRLRPAWPCIHEMSLWLGRNLPGGNDAVTGMNKGGTVETAGVRVTMTPADHSGSDWNAEGSVPLYLGEAAGFVVELENGFRIYHAGDTSAFLDWALLGEMYRPELVMLPIGGHYTMGPWEAARAVSLLRAKHVLPLHYGTFPILAGTPAQLRNELGSLGVENVTVYEPEPGGSLG